jgi:hypothetical protein
LQIEEEDAEKLKSNLGMLSLKKRKSPLNAKQKMEVAVSNCKRSIISLKQELKRLQPTCGTRYSFPDLTTSSTQVSLSQGADPISKTWTS